MEWLFAVLTPLLLYVAIRVVHHFRVRRGYQVLRRDYGANWG